MYGVYIFFLITHTHTQIFEIFQNRKEDKRRIVQIRKLIYKTEEKGGVMKLVVIFRNIFYINIY